jgi:hypothetical protein
MSISVGNARCQGRQEAHRGNERALRLFDARALWVGAVVDARRARTDGPPGCSQRHPSIDRGSGQDRWDGALDAEREGAFARRVGHEWYVFVQLGVPPAPPVASRMPVSVEIDVSVGRLPAAVEATADSSWPRRSPTSRNTLAPSTPRSRRASRTAPSASKCATASERPARRERSSGAGGPACRAGRGAPDREPGRRRHVRRRRHPSPGLTGRSTRLIGASD